MTEPAIRTLLIEDDEDDYLLTRELLEEIRDGRYQLDWVATYDEGLERLGQGAVDVCLVDYRIGSRTGLELVNEARSAGLAAPMILLTGLGDRDLDIAAMEAGAADYLEKGKLTAALLERSIRYALSEAENRRALVEKSTLLLSTLQSIDQGICAFDARRRLLTSNRRFADMFGHSEALLSPGRPLVEVLRPVAEQGELGPGDPDEAIARHADALYSGEQQRSERERADGSILEIAVNPMPDGGIVVTFADITDRKKAEKERETLLEQFHATQKMQAVGTLAGGIAHDFNNILGIILGYTELVLHAVQDDEKVVRNLNQVLTAGRRAADMVRQILAFSRNYEIERKPVRLDQLVTESLGLLRATVPTTIDIDSSIEVEPAVTLADETQLQQVFMNLVVNGSHAIGDRPGRITVTLKRIEVTGELTRDLRAQGFNEKTPFIRSEGEGEDERTKVYVGLLAPGPHLRLAVADDGCGMDRRVMTRIFDPFFTTKEVGKGTGLGLSTVHGIIAGHEGALTVVSAPGRGTGFEVFLKQVAEAEASEGAGEAEVRGNGERILLVDDEEHLVDMARQTLEAFGYEVMGMTSPSEALETFRAAPAVWDLVITDRAMPGLSGEDMAAEMVRLREDLPVLLCTGYSDTLSEAALKAVGIRECLMKPLVGRELCGAVRRVLDS